MAIGSGLLTTLAVETGSPPWIGYQVIFGMGVGFGLQQALIAMQTCLSVVDTPTGTAIIMFSQTLGGAIFIAVAQNIFSNQLPRNIAATGVQGISSSLVAGVGATQLKAVIASISPDLMEPVLHAYNKTLNETLYVSVALAAVSVIGAGCVEWKSVKSKIADSTVSI